MNKKKFLALALAAAMSLSLAACGSNGGSSSSAGSNSGSQSGSGSDVSTPAGEASGTFNVGVIGPLTGGAAIYGTAVANAAQIAVEEINALGGDVPVSYTHLDVYKRQAFGSASRWP